MLKLLTRFSPQSRNASHAYALGLNEIHRAQIFIAAIFIGSCMFPHAFKYMNIWTNLLDTKSVVGEISKSGRGTRLSSCGPCSKG